MLEIPWRRLGEDALRGLIEEYVSREGTDYGQFEVSFEEKTAEVMRQIASGRVAIVYDEQSSMCNIVLKEDLLRYAPESPG